MINYANKVFNTDMYRTNITPKQFYSYCKREYAKRRNGANFDDFTDSFENWESPAVKGKTIFSEREFDERDIFVIEYTIENVHFSMEFMFYEEEWDDNKAFSQQKGTGYTSITEYECIEEGEETKEAEEAIETEATEKNIESTYSVAYETSSGSHVYSSISISHKEGDKEPMQEMLKAAAKRHWISVKPEWSDEYTYVPYYNNAGRMYYQVYSCFAKDPYVYADEIDLPYTKQTKVII